MKIYSVYLLSLVILTISCNSTRNASDYFNRPNYKPCITAFETGFMFCNGIKKPIPPKMQIPETPEESESMIDYFTDKEFRLYLCLRFSECN
jgi:hypothetical protein